MMDAHLWKPLACAYMPVSSRSATPSNGCRKKKITPILKAVAPVADERAPGESDALAATGARLLLPGPLANASQETGQQVREQYLAHLAKMRENPAVLGPLAQAFEHFCHITDNFAAGLFRCYEIAGLPRTNNDLEHCFGVARVHERRATGRRGAIPGVVVRGSVRVMASVKS